MAIWKCQAGCSKRPSSKVAGESEPEAYPQGYVEDFKEPRTKLADFFSILLVEQDDVEQRTANAQSAIVIDEAQLPELIQKETDS